jgi:hypothetical protein
MAKNNQTFIVVVVGLLLLLVQSIAANSTSAYSTSRPPPPPSSLLSSALPPPSSSPVQCDPSLWQHVYDPSRLQVIKNCVTVTGTITNIQAETDGDYHVRVKLDPQYANMTNSANNLYQGGDLIVEAICEHSVSATAAAAYANFIGKNITIPMVGSHVIVTGSYALDKNHFSWAENHPATAITVINATTANNIQ